jgi:hypothetical protein
VMPDNFSHFIGTVSISSDARHKITILQNNFNISIALLLVLTQIPLAAFDSHYMHRLCSFQSVLGECSDWRTLRAISFPFAR